MNKWKSAFGLLPICLVASCGSFPLTCGDYHYLRLANPGAEVVRSGRPTQDRVTVDHDIPLEQRVVVDGLTIVATHYEAKLPTLRFTATDADGKALAIADYAIARPGMGCSTWDSYRPTTFTWMGGEDCGVPAVTATFSNGQSVRLEFEKVDAGRACSVDAL